MPSRKNLVRNSSVIRAINSVGDYWVMLIMSEALLGSCRYGEFFEFLDITHATLSSRLKRMVETGLLFKVDHAVENNRKEYHLTDKGTDLFQVMLVIRDWERTYIELEGRKNPKSQFTHLKCGRQVRPILVCAHCGELVHTRDVESGNGPGAGEEQAAPARMQRQIAIAEPKASRDSQSPLARALVVVGDRWATMILAASFRGNRRFDEYRLQLKISPRILSQRLTMLVGLKMLERRVYQQAPDRYEYRLTEKAIEFYPIIVSLMTWGDRWLAGKKGPPIILHHKLCGKRLKPLLTCSYCHAGLKFDEIRLRTWQ